MSARPSIEEMQADLDATNRDIKRLEAIVLNLKGFINDPGGEDRSIFKVDLMKWEVILQKGLRLRDRIAEWLLEAALR